jgi:type II secretory pathway component GspD/PulD (secretin)
MTKLVRSLPGAAAVALCLLLHAPSAGAADNPTPSASPAGNVLLKFRIGRLEAGRRVPVRSYDLLVANDGSMARLLSGARVPIPTTSRESDAPGAAEERKLTTYTYQNVGFSAEARASVVDKTKIRLSANIEDSRVKPGEAGAPPTVETRTLSVEALLTEGVPIEVVRVEGNEESGYVEVEAKILR